MNIEIKTERDHIRVTLWRHRNHSEVQLFALGTTFEFNGSSEFIARKDNQITKPLLSLMDDL